MGRLIPAGTGMEYYRRIHVENPFEDMEEEQADPLELTKIAPDIAPEKLVKTTEAL